MAIKDYEDRKAGKKREPVEHEGAQCYTEDHDHGCKCPYCESDIDVDVETCGICGRKVENNTCE